MIFLGWILYFGKKTRSGQLISKPYFTAILEQVCHRNSGTYSWTFFDFLFSLLETSFTIKLGGSIIVGFGECHNLMFEKLTNLALSFGSIYFHSCCALTQNI
jgi:hypothetical protein